VADSPVISVAWTVKLKVPEADGIPEIIPEFRFNPAGSAPPDIAHV
jgi:hypothetical protein